MTHKEIMYEIANKLHKAFPNASIAVGGSVANGTYKLDSDIDLLFVQEEYDKAFSISFKYKGINISLFAFPHSFIQKKENTFLYTFNNMPITFIHEAQILYDRNMLIYKLKERVKGIIERRFYLKNILIENLQNDIQILLHKKSYSYIDKKLNYYNIINNILCIFFLQQYPRQIFTKYDIRNIFSILQKKHLSLEKSNE